MSEEREKIEECMVPLSLATFDQISTEIDRRFPHMAVIVRRDGTDQAGDRLQAFRWNGDHDLVVGMLNFLAYRVMKAKLSGVEPVDGDAI